MKGYVVKSKTVNKSQIIDKDFIFSSSRHNSIVINSNNERLMDLINQSTQTESLNSKKAYYNYIEIGCINTSTGYIYPVHKKSIDISTNSVYKLQKGDILISTVRTYLGGIGIINKNDENLVSSKALLVLRELKKDIDRYYLFGILRSKFFIDQTNLILNASMYPRIDKDNIDSLKIPFPTMKNNQEPMKVQNTVSLIIRNILNKEEEIIRKNKLIDNLIEKELIGNQKNKQFKYSYPKISDIKQEGRWDTGIFEKTYKRSEFIIQNYNNGFFFLDENKINPGSTPDDYHYSEEKRNSNFYLWVTPKNINHRELSFKTYIYTRKKTKVKNNSLILNGIRYVGNGIFSDGNDVIYTNQNTLIINQFEDSLNQLFLYCFLTSKMGRNLQMIRRCFGIVPILYTEQLCRIPIPKFKDSKKKEIAQYYYNSIEKNNNLTNENYLEIEKERNKNIGIFQLNKEIFELKDKLEDIVHKIIMEEKINIDFKY